MLCLLLACHDGTVASSQVRSTCLCFVLNKVISSGRKWGWQREGWVSGRKGKKEPCLVFGHSWEVPGGAFSPSSRCPDGDEAAGVMWLDRGHRASEGRARSLLAFHIRLGSLSPGGQGTAGLRGLKDDQLVLRQDNGVQGYQSAPACILAT